MAEQTPNSPPTPPAQPQAMRAERPFEITVTNTRKHVIGHGRKLTGADPLFLVPGVPARLSGEDAMLFHPEKGHPQLLSMVERGIIVTGRQASKAANAEAIEALGPNIPGQRRGNLQMGEPHKVGLE